MQKDLVGQFAEHLQAGRRRHELKRKNRLRRRAVESLQRRADAVAGMIAPIVGGKLRRGIDRRGLRGLEQAKKRPGRRTLRRRRGHDAARERGRFIELRASVEVLLSRACRLTRAELRELKRRRGQRLDHQWPLSVGRRRDDWNEGRRREHRYGRDKGQGRDQRIGRQLQGHRGERGRGRRRRTDVSQFRHDLHTHGARRRTNGKTDEQEGEGSAVHSYLEHNSPSAGLPGDQGPGLAKVLRLTQSLVYSTR